MNLRRHSPTLVANKHAILSPSNYHWVNYDDDKMKRAFYTQEAAARGTRHHNLAQILISEGVRLPDTSETLNLYVNDCIGYRMTPEWLLYFSDNCFGTADACGFRTNKLRVFDLKTGVTEASMIQLEVYTALFCLEYGFRPFDIEMDLRIYQNDQVRMHEPDPDDIMHIMEKIKYLDKLINTLKEA